MHTQKFEPTDKKRKTIFFGHHNSSTLHNAIRGTSNSDSLQIMQ